MMALHFTDFFGRFGPTARSGQMSRRDWVTTAFIVFGLGMTMSVSQVYTGEQSFIRYLMFTVPVVAVVAIRPMQWVQALGGKSMLLVTMLLTGGVWHVLKGDTQAAMQLFLLTIGFVWYGVRNVRINEADIYRLYWASIALGVVVWLTTDLNQWGLLPGTTSEEFGIWRVSFFPNIAYTAFFSLFVILIMTKDGLANIKAHPLTFGIAAYYLIFSFVRTALICMIIYGITMWIAQRIRRPSALFPIMAALAIGINLVIAFSASIFDALQHIPVISRLFLRGETQLSEFEIYQQLYRPWLWGEQFKMLVSSPGLMGWGSVPFTDLVQNSIFDFGVEAGDTVSMPTKLMAQFGLPAFLFWAYVFFGLYERARAADRWACACFPVVVLAMMQWGSMFHVSDVLCLFYSLLFVKGRDMFVGGAPMLRRRTLRRVAG